jgi:RND family efflux transporter MFP subunit
MTAATQRPAPRAALFVLLVTALACGAPEGGRQEASPAPRPVRTAVVAVVDAAAPVAPGVVVARQRATLAARIPAAVRDLPFEEGAVVRAGEVVARLDDDALRAALHAAQAGHAAAEADARRFARLLERQAATARETETATARAAAAASAVAAAREALAYAVLRAPFAGRLASRLVREGDVVAPGQPLVTVEGDAGFELRANVSGAGAAALAPGTRLRATIDGVGEIEATVRAVSSAGDPGTHRFEMIAGLEPAAGLRSGLYGRLALPAVAGATGEPAIPAAAAFARGGLIGVFVVEDGVARLRWIATGERRGELLIVRAGLAAGERVVLDPAALADGDPVTLVEDVEDTER